MDIDPNLYYTLLGISALVTGWIAYYAWKKRNKAGLTIFLLYFLIWLWSASTLAMVVSPTPLLKYGFLGLIQVSYLFIPVLWLLFVLEFSGRGNFVTRRNAAALLIVPVILLLVYLTNPWHHLFIESFETASHYYTVDVELGPAHDALNVYNFAVLIGAIIVLADMLRSPQKKYRRQAATGIVATLAPWVAGMIYLYGEMEGNPVPIGFAVTGVLVAYSVFYQGYLDIVPVARDTVVDRINNGVVVVDEDDTVVDINQAGRQIFGLGGGVVGQKLESVLFRHPEVLSHYHDLKEGKENRKEFSIQEGEGVNYYQFEVTPLYDDDVRVGNVLMVNDVTELRSREEKLRKREQELAEQNKRLDKFASIVSHDLRNPLNVAQGYTEMLSEELDRSEVNHIRDAQQRMQNIIDDALTLAREGYEITHRKEVNLAAIAEKAWSNVNKGNASLNVNADIQVNADKNKLLNVFENLYRNAIEHGGEDVRIDVGLIEDQNKGTQGFYVEDDGPGIPPEKREEVFEQGYSTNSEGTGLGLSIVKTIVEAHGWDIGVEEGMEGGARIEITGISEKTSKPDKPVPE